ncbi:MAG: radical SAM family heme chaperone HemW [Bacteroidales bacterium]|nr:radical SAM family heme chaperone HemW [Bacteroidales bacterium]
MSGLYLHIPFCQRKCIYCNFYSVAKLELADAFISALALEMKEALQWFPCTKFKSLYLGGGTPTLLSIMQLEKIKMLLDSHFSFTENIEFTIEANPEQLTRSYLQALQKLGVNRLSIGVQSFNNKILSTLRRLHTAEQADKAIRRAAEAGFNNISIDLIYGIAEREADTWRQELQNAFALPITHLSAYSLTVEENTILYQQLRKNKLRPVDDTAALRDYAELQQAIVKAGFRQYEVSNYCKEGYHSRHNSIYWNSTPYLGLGPAAHSFTGTMRRWNLAHLERYISNLQTHNNYWESEQLSPENCYNEYIMLGLRTEKGINLHYIKSNFGAKYYKMLQQQLLDISSTFYQQQDNQIKLTAAGLLLADSIAAALFV